MPTCPNCKHEFRQRKNGGCPDCGELLEKHGKFYYRARLGSPSKSLLEHFERLVSAKTSAKQQKKIVFVIPRKTARYPRELVEAERLLDACEGEYSLAEETLTTLFNNKQFYRIYSTLIGIMGDFLLAKTITEANRAERAAADNVQEGFYIQVMERENLFSY